MIKSIWLLQPSRATQGYTKPVTDWLETLPHSRPYIQTEYVREIPIGHRGLIEMERNDLWF